MDLGLREEFMNLAKKVKAQINQWAALSFCTTKETVNKTKRQPIQ